MSQREWTTAWMACLAALSLVSCKSGPPPVRMGTAEWYWNAAREQYAAGDFVKTQEHLEKLMDGDSQFKARAASWYVVLLAGMARGSRELADAYEDGAPAAKAQTADFRRTVNDQRRMARHSRSLLAEQINRVQQETDKADKVALEFAFPIGSAAEPPTLINIRKGLLPQDAERASVNRQSIARGIVLQAAAAVGEDPAKAAEMFKAQPLEVPRFVFLHGVADGLVEQSALFNRKKLQEPDKKKILLDLAAGCAKSAGEAAGDDAMKKKIKDLQAKIEKEQKSIGKV